MMFFLVVVAMLLLSSSYCFLSFKALHSVSIVYHKINIFALKRYKCAHVSVPYSRLNLKDDDFDEEFEDKLQQKLGRVPLRSDNKVGENVQ